MKRGGVRRRAERLDCVGARGMRRGMLRMEGRSCVGVRGMKSEEGGGERMKRLDCVGVWRGTERQQQKERKEVKALTCVGRG